MMSAEKDLAVEERILQLLQHLGIPKAHFAARVPTDWIGLASRHPEVISSLALVCPSGIDSDDLRALTSRLLVFTGDRGNSAQVGRTASDLSEATVITFAGYSVSSWTDVIADYPDLVRSSILDFLAAINSLGAVETLDSPTQEGEVAGVQYRIRGSGPPLILFPLALAPSQWNPIVDELAQRYCTISLGGAELGFVAPLEARGHSKGYLRVIRNLVDELQIEPGHSVLDVGCGSGVLARWLAKETKGANRVTAVDINPYLLGEAASLTKYEGLEHLIEFHEGSAEALPLPDDGFDATLSVTVLEEGNADRMLAEMVRVTQPGGRVAVMVRAIDVPFVVNVLLPAELKSKLEDPGGSVEPEGCADGSIYMRVKKAGLTNIKMFPQLATFEAPFGPMGQFLQNRVLRNLSPEEQKEWRVAESRAATAGTLFFAWPHHCVVGTKP